MVLGGNAARDKAFCPAIYLQPEMAQAGSSSDECVGSTRKNGDLMKRMVCTSGLASILFVTGACAQEKSAGFIDFGKLPASRSGKEFVEVSVGRPLFVISSKLFEKSEPEVAGLLRGLQLVQVNVVGLAEDNRDQMKEHIRKLRADL